MTYNRNRGGEGMGVNERFGVEGVEESSKAGQGRAITRGEEARVRRDVAKALGVSPAALAFYFDHAGRCGSIAMRVDASNVRDLNEAERASAARAGIVPGPEGWCWAAAPLDACPLCHASAPYTHQPGCAEPRPIVGSRGTWSVGAPPAWLTAAVLAALPPDGTPCSLLGLAPRITKPADARGEGVEETRAALAALVASGEIEAGEGGRAWRRWGVSEGWEIRDDHAGWEYIVREGAPLGDQIACVRRDGHWTIFRGEDSCSPLIEGDGGQRAALRACYERGVFGPRPAPTVGLETPQGAPMGEQAAIAAAVAAPAPARAEQVRLALLAVLTRGAVATRGMLLPIVEGEMGAPAGSVEPAEARQAAREIGAEVDGPRWSLPAMPAGWGWRRVIASRWYLAPLDASDPERERVASLAVDDGVGGIGGLLWRVKGAVWQGCESVEEGQAAALQAARLAGLFAAPRVEVAPIAPAPVEAPMGPLDALARILTGETAPTFEGMREALDVWALANEERTVRRLYDAARREDEQADAADPLHLAVSAARQRFRSADPGTDEWSAAEIEVARTTGALLDVLGVEVPSAPAPLLAGLDAADRATLDAVGRLREVLTALCAGPGQWRWKVDESVPDAAARLLGEMSSRIADFETVQRVGEAHRQEMRAARDAALSELATLKADLAALHARWATGARGAT